MCPVYTPRRAPTHNAPIVNSVQSAVIIRTRRHNVNCVCLDSRALPRSQKFMTAHRRRQPEGDVNRNDPLSSWRTSPLRGARMISDAPGKLQRTLETRHPRGQGRDSLPANRGARQGYGPPPAAISLGRLLLFGRLGRPPSWVAQFAALPDWTFLGRRTYGRSPPCTGWSFARRHECAHSWLVGSATAGAQATGGDRSTQSSNPRFSPGAVQSEGLAPLALYL